jgi:hypothetical protein
MCEAFAGRYPERCLGLHCMPAGFFFRTAVMETRNSYNRVSINGIAALSFVTAGGCAVFGRQHPRPRGRLVGGPTESGGDGMDTKTLSALAALVPLAIYTSATAQQPQPGYTYPQQAPGGYQQPPASYPQQAPPANYQQPSNYQAPAQTPPSYQQPPATNYQQPPAYQQQSPPAYQQPSPNYPQQTPSGYQQPPSSSTAGYTQPSTNYQQPPSSYQQPTAGSRPQSTNYAQPPAAGAYPQSAAGYQQPPAGAYPQPSAGGYAVPPTPGYPQPQGAAGYQQPLNYQQQMASYPQPVNQASTQAWSSEEQIDPRHKHEDARHNHNHVYPDRGTVVRTLPATANVVNYGGQSYWFADGVWFEPRGAAYTVIEPPIGLVVASLPSFATAVSGSAGLYFYANDTYYRPRPDLGGYEVVNDPVDSAPAGSYAPSQAAPLYSATAAPPPGALAVPASAAAMTAAVPAMAAAQPTMAAPAAAGQFSSRPPQMVALSPNNGQTPEQQARDRYDCYRLALGQTGYDPLHPKGGMPTAQSSEQQDAYDRVRTSCLQGRGYTVH